MGWYGGWRPYVPVARRRAQAAQYAARLAKKERRELSPVSIDGRKIAHSFWGSAWCDNLERYSDFANRLPRGRTYVRNGSVIDLTIAKGKVKAIVSGSEIYHVTIGIKTLTQATWTRIKQDCSQSITSLIDLLQGRFDRGIMERLTQKHGGLFPQPSEIEMDCTCPDWADMCKHVAAVLYGIGARLDSAPEMLFTLRNVDQLELIGQAVAAENLDRALDAGPSGELAGKDLGELFGIELDSSSQPRSQPRSRRRRPASPAPSAPLVVREKSLAQSREKRRTPPRSIKRKPAKARVRRPAALPQPS